MSRTLEMLEHHHSHEMTYMQRVSRRVNAKVSRGHLLLELLVGAGHHLVDHASPSKFFYEIHIMN